MEGGNRFDRIARNRDLANGCRRHSFKDEIPGIEGGVGSMFGGKMTCVNCGGSLSLIEINQYVRGYEANGGNGNDIIPGWKNDEQPKRKFFGQDRTDKT